MNVGSLIKQELQTLLTDLEGSEIGEKLKTYIDAEIERVEAEIKQYVDAVIAKAFQPSKPQEPGSQTQG